MCGLKRYRGMCKILTPANLNLNSVLSESDRTELLVQICRLQYFAHVSIPYKTASTPPPPPRILGKFSFAFRVRLPGTGSRLDSIKGTDLN